MTDPNIDPDLAAREAAIALEYDVAAFLESRVGRWLMYRAQNERADALEKLAQVRPHDEHAIAELQAQVRVRDHFIRWLQEALQAGKNAATEQELADADD